MDLEKQLRMGSQESNRKKPAQNQGISRACVMVLVVSKARRKEEDSEEGEEKMHDWTES